MSRPHSVLAFDTQLTTLAETVHSLLGLGSAVSLPEDVTVCTHMVRDSGVPHYGYSIAFSSAPTPRLLQELCNHFAPWPYDYSDHPHAESLSLALTIVAAQAWSGDGGRAVHFPGWTRFRGELSIGEVLSDTMIDRVDALGGTSPQTSDVLHTRDFVRPLFRNGELVLPVMPAGPGGFAPFEVPNPTPCCAVHVRPGDLRVGRNPTTANHC